MKIAIILFNLGGPKNLKEVKPFLFSLFNDKAIIALSQPFRYLLANFISTRRENTAQEIYKLLGGGSPILQETAQQAQALEKSLNNDRNGNIFKTIIAMRHTAPFAKDALKEAKEFNPDRIILLPLYPQFSTTTTGSSFKQWDLLMKKEKKKPPTDKICCYPNDLNFINAHCDLINKHIKNIKNISKSHRILFSAHGLPQKIVNKGDPYQWQIEENCKNIVENLNLERLDYKICYQSKVGPLKWLEPSLDSEIKKAAKDNKAIIIVPISFVSEHSETKVELDIEYKKLADGLGIKEYIRIPTLSCDSNYIKSLKELCLAKLKEDKNFYKSKTCPNSFVGCDCK